jgi:hypothetical protein
MAHLLRARGANAAVHSPTRAKALAPQTSPAKPRWAAGAAPVGQTVTYATSLKEKGSANFDDLVELCQGANLAETSSIEECLATMQALARLAASPGLPPCCHALSAMLPHVPVCPTSAPTPPAGPGPCVPILSCRARHAPRRVRGRLPSRRGSPTVQHRALHVRRAAREWGVAVQGWVLKRAPTHSPQPNNTMPVSGVVWAGGGEGWRGVRGEHIGGGMARAWGGVAVLAVLVSWGGVVVLVSVGDPGRG